MKRIVKDPKIEAKKYRIGDLVRLVKGYGDYTYPQYGIVVGKEDWYNMVYLQIDQECGYFENDEIRKIKEK